jgi:hypothetical protein
MPPGLPLWIIVLLGPDGEPPGMVFWKFRTGSATGKFTQVS